MCCFPIARDGWDINEIEKHGRDSGDISFGRLAKRMLQLYFLSSRASNLSIHAADNGAKKMLCVEAVMLNRNRGKG